jgi:hypothetical protein
MNRRNLFAIAAIAASLTLSPAVYAATSIHTPVNAMFGKSASSKTVKLTLINDSNAPMEVKAGDDIVKLEAGKPVTVSLPIGTRVTATTASSTHEAGALLAQVSDSLNGAILHIK